MNIKLYNPSEKEAKLYSSTMTDVVCCDGICCDGICPDDAICPDIGCCDIDVSCDSSCGGGCVGETGSNSVSPGTK